MMSFGDDFNKELDEVLEKRDKVAQIFSLELHRAIIKVTPVDTGSLKRAWEWDIIAKGHYRSSNNLPYAIKIDGGRRTVNGKIQGSEQLQDGFQPTIKRENKRLQKLLKGIK